MFYRLLDQNLKTPACVALHHRVRRKIIVVWDRLNVPRSAARQLMEEHPDWFDFEWLPPYAPDLNPIEQWWNHTKYAELANVIPDDLDDLYALVQFTINENRKNTPLLNAFLAFTHLRL